MRAYKTTAKLLSGTNIHEVIRVAMAIYKRVKGKTKRRPYLRSAYFNKEKVFLSLFWDHLFNKGNWRDRTRRLKYFTAALELVQNSRLDPITKENPNKEHELLHRFTGITSSNQLFYVQIKEDKRKGQKWLISVFPEDE